jgi:hypothetical protein
MRIFWLLLTIYFISGCATEGEYRSCEFFDDAKDLNSFGVLWSWCDYVGKPLSIGNATIVTKVDEITFTKCGNNRPPIALLPGPHTIEVEIFRLVPIPSYFPTGYYSLDGNTKITIFIEAGHSYQTYSNKSCGKEWIWVVDTGRSSVGDYKAWKSHSGVLAVSYGVKKGKDNLKVVSGRLPPSECAQNSITP